MLSRHLGQASRVRRASRALAWPPANAVIGILLSALTVAACGGGAASTPGVSSGAAASAQVASGAPVSSSANAASSPAATTGAGTGAIPADECSVVTKADVEAAFGGSSSAGTIDENGHCTFSVSGTIHAGPNAGVPGTVGVSFGDKFDPYDTAKFLFGDAVTKVDGLGTEAWYGLTAVHAKIAGGELVVGGLWVANVDKAIVEKDTITLAKAILAHL
jgi:hypothetical protein